MYARKEKIKIIFLIFLTLAMVGNTIIFYIYKYGNTFLFSLLDYSLNIFQINTNFNVKIPDRKSVV